MAPGVDSIELRIELAVELDADETELDAATRRLRQELLGLDVDDVEQPPAGAAPPGTRSVGAALAGTLIVTSAQDLMQAIFHTVARWVGTSSARSVKLSIDGDSIEVTDPSAEDERRLIQAFLDRHAGEAGRHGPEA